MTSPTRADGIALAVLATLAALLISAPAAVITDVPFDVFIPLDAGWRALHGQVPHIDFHTPVGALWYALYGGCMALFGPTERVLMFAPVVASVPVILLALWVGLDRLDAGPRAIFTVFVGLTAMSPRSLDGPALSFLASYNRIGWALASIALLQLLLPRSERRDDRVESTVLACILLTLFFLKITYFASVGLGCVLVLVLVPQNRKIAVGGGLGSWLGIGLLAVISSLPAAYMSDLLLILASSTDGNERTGLVKLLADLKANFIPLTGTLAALGWAATRDRTWRIPAAALGAVFLGLLTAQQSHDHAIPLLMVPVLIAAAHIRPLLEKQPLLPLLLVGVSALMPVVNDGIAIVLNAALSRSARTMPAWPGARARFVGAPEDANLEALRNGSVPPEVYFADAPPMNGADLALLLTDGHELLTSHIDPADRVLTVASSPAMTWLSKTPPPRGTDAWYDYGRTFGPNRPIDAAETLSEVTLVMDPIGVQSGTIDRVRHDLLPALEADFTPHEAPLWTIWSRD